ncbi:hypothetical protein B0T18DRAFT_16637 [Schizothecium vesticola]|uniref:Uncharacterized protein n=1 Tax=Schizothecium vesticola TaxID=314040 RepID=A0AA40KC83_9PEZI|nr:hypothetical protein B0T18DRAFT_16637 [Schizothecium vesticola]
MRSCASPESTQTHARMEEREGDEKKVYSALHLDLDLSNPHPPPSPAWTTRKTSHTSMSPDGPRPAQSSPPRAVGTARSAQCRCPAASQRLALPCACPTLRQPDTAGDEKGIEGVEQHGRTREAGHGPLSLFVLGTVTGVAAMAEQTTAQPSRALTPDRSPTSSTTTTTTTRLHREPLDFDPLELAPYTVAQPSGRPWRAWVPPASRPSFVNTSSSRLIRPPRLPFSSLLLSFCSSPGPCAVSVPDLCQSSPFLVATDTFGCNPIHSSC